ncbi:MAG: transcription elongation factor GreA [Bacteroidales bacterium]
MTYVTEEGLKKMKEELKQMQTVERPAISRQIAEARDKGDLAENAEYDAAKDAQAMLEMKIAELQEIISSARVIDPSKIDTKTVRILSKIKIRNTKNNTVMKYQIVAESEADLKTGKISIDTPIAKGLLGKEVGDVVDVDVPNGKLQLEILEISM